MNTVQPPITVEEIRIAAGGLPYQARLHYGEGRIRGAVILAPPHPFLGGNFDNNVLHFLAGQFAAQGLAALTYNLPGVGETPARPGSASARARFWSSEALGADAEADAADFRSLADRLRGMAGVSSASIIAGGYSYGGAVAALAARGASFGGLFLVSPPLDELEPGVIASAGAPVRVILAENELAATPEAVLRVRDAGAADLTVVRIAEADHFFLDHLEHLALEVGKFITPLNSAAPPCAPGAQTQESIA